jgi:hypothetical protein
MYVCKFNNKIIKLKNKNPFFNTRTCSTST